MRAELLATTSAAPLPVQPVEETGIFTNAVVPAPPPFSVLDMLRACQELTNRAIIMMPPRHMKSMASASTLRVVIDDPYDPTISAELRRVMEEEFFAMISCFHESMKS